MNVDWAALLKGESSMTLNIVFGLLLGDGIVRLGLAERLLRGLLPVLKKIGIGPILSVALTLSIGSSKAGAALLAAALEEGRIEKKGALWGTLALSFPAYLRRWPSTFFLASGMAGTAGGVFALVLLLRSLGRFLLVVSKSRYSESERSESEAVKVRPPGFSSLYRRLWKTLPLAWLFFAAAFLLMPQIENLLKEKLGGSFLPAAGWGVAAAAVAGITASLALAGGSLSSGELSVSQTVFALLLGNGLGYLTRAVRQNAGYFFGLYPLNLARSILFWSVVTMLPFVAVSLVLSAIPLLF